MSEGFKRLNFIRMMKPGNKILCFLLFSFLLSCSNPIPKPYGYYRIEMPEHTYERCNRYKDFNFDISLHAVIKQVTDTIKGEWFDICYPDFNARIYCSYFHINPAQLADLSEDCRKFVFRHVMKANAINEEQFSIPENNVHGTLYRLEGNVASPLQFVLTDSVNNFFRASLLFDNPPNQDSIAPALNYIKEDVERLIESFRWGIYRK